MTNKRTPQQQAYVDALLGGTSNIVLKAVAGSGKTYTLVQGATEYKAPGMALAFNKRNQEDLQRKMPPGIECKTMNALGHAAWAKQVGKGLQVDGNKIKSLVDRMWPQWKDRMKTPGLARFVDMLRLHEVVPRGAPFQGRPNNDSDEFFSEIYENYDLGGWDDEDVDMGLVFERARQVLNTSIEMAWKKQIDFVDQLYMPICYNAPFDPQPFVMVDEVQDLSPIQHKMVRRTAFRGRIVAAGDPRQAIYGFAGAMSNSMDHLVETFQMDVMPLTWCFRCPAGVVRKAQRYNPEIEPAPGTEAGIVAETRGLEGVRMGDVILSYRNAALLEAAFALIARGVGAKLVGSGDLGSQLIKLAKKFSFPQAEFIRASSAWGDRQADSLVAANKEAQAQRLRDKVYCLQLIAINADASSQDDMEAAIKKIFAMDGSAAPVLCSTIHKSKGLEWPRVHIYRFRDVFKGWSRMSPEQQMQRQNMAYVQITRAQKELYFIEQKEEDETND